MTDMRKDRPRREDYRHFLEIPTRWMDNDVYGHVNNVVYYSYFDTVVNQFLIEHAGLDVHRSEVFGVVVETGCRYHEQIAFPDVLEAGMRVASIGNSSVRLEIGIFKVGDTHARADGHFTHVYVDRVTRRPTRVPEGFRIALQRLAF